MPLSSHLEKIIVTIIALLFLAVGIYVSGWKAASDKREIIQSAAVVETIKEHEQIKKQILQEPEYADDAYLSHWMRDTQHSRSAH